MWISDRTMCVTHLTNSCNRRGRLDDAPFKDVVDVRSFGARNASNLDQTVPRIVRVGPGYSGQFAEVF